MTTKSKYFDSIRSKPGTKSASSAKPQARPCQWKGCEGEGKHRAPMGRGQEGRYYLFCEEHIRQYNASYNYFLGMSEKEVANFQKDSITGHRPTWKAGANAWAHGKTSGSTADPAAASAGLNGPKLNDPHGFFAWRAKRVAGENEEPKRYVKPLERKALDTLNLAENANKDEIKARFKDLVKRHHPDANGGDKGSEERLREIIQAYNLLKSGGLV
jgi:curved DNA-binding protein CbpA